MNQNLFVTFLEKAADAHGTDSSGHVAHENAIENAIENAGGSAGSAKHVHNKVLEHRLIEMESREEILEHLKAIHRDQLWKILGYKSLPAFCRKELGYTAREARDIAITLGAILISKSLKSEDPVVQMRINALRAWRREASQSEGLAAYRIFSNRTLLHLAHENPLCTRQLSDIIGLGPRRIEVFGADLLRVLARANSPKETSTSDAPYQPSLPSDEA